MRIEPRVVDLWVACLQCQVAMPLGSWHVHDGVVPDRLDEGVRPNEIGHDAQLPMDRGLANALEIAVEAFTAYHDHGGDHVLVHELCPMDMEIQSEPDPTAVDASGARDMVPDPERGADAEARSAFAIHRMTRDADKRAAELEELACLGLAREALAGGKTAKRYVVWRRDKTTEQQMYARAVDVIRERGLVTDALELMRRFFLQPEAVPEMAAAVASSLADSSTPAAERERLFRFARSSIPEAIDRAYRGGKLPPEPLPRSWEQHASHPLGRELLALSVRLAEIKKGLASSDATRAGIALKVLQDLVRIQPQVAGAAQPWLRPLLTDERRLPRGGAMATVAVPLYRSALAALDNKRVRELLPYAIEQSLSVFDHLSLGFWSYYNEARELHVRKSTVLKALLELLGDPDIPARTRVRARRVLDRGPAEQAVIEAKRRADEIVLEILRDPDETDEVRDAMYEHLRKWMPNRIPELRGNLIERVSTMPTMSELRKQHGYKLGTALQELSTQVEIAEVARLVAKGKSAARDQIETALALVLHITSWRDEAAAELEPAVRARLRDRDWPEPKKVAAIYAKLLVDMAESGSGVPDVDEVINDIAVIPQDSLDRETWTELLGRLGEVYAADRVPSWLTFRATDPETSSAVRYAAYAALSRRAELSPELRAGIGISAASAEPDMAERIRIIGLLCNAQSDRAIEAAKSDKLPAIELPGIEWFHKIWEDGVADRRPGRHDVAALLVPPDEIIDALGAADRLGQTLAALELLPTVLEVNPELRTTAAEALATRLWDSRSRGSARSSYRFTVMPQALEQYLDVIGDDPVKVERALLATLGDTETARYAVHCFRPQLKGHWIQMIGCLFDAAAGHREAPGRRLAAWIALSEAGNSDHPAADQLAAAAGRVTPAMRGLLGEPETPASVVETARRHELID